MVIVDRYDISGEKMKHDVGTQYAPDDAFKAKARLHHSKYRANVLQVDFDEYGNRLQDPDGRRLLNYFDGLGVREALRNRYPNYSKDRDADMLRSEHIPFNIFPPLELDEDFAKRTILNAFGVECDQITAVECEWAPRPKNNYLNDKTSFDAYVSYISSSGKKGGLGIEVKYTEREYSMGKTEGDRVRDRTSTYWTTTRTSGAFIDGGNKTLGADPLRQIWRNHLLGLAMIQSGEVEEFYSITLHPEGNRHFGEVIPRYQALLNEADRQFVFGCTFERFFESITGNSEVEQWKAYLIDRYVVK